MTRSPEISLGNNTVIRSFAFGVILDSSKEFTSVNDSEALVTADNSTMVWTTTKQVIETFAAPPG